MGKFILTFGLPLPEAISSASPRIITKLESELAATNNSVSASEDKLIAADFTLGSVR